MSPLSKLSRTSSKRNVALAANTPSRNERSFSLGSKPQRSNTSSSLRSLFHMRHKYAPEATARNESQSPIALSPASPGIATLALAFVNALDSVQVSNFVAWFLYFDVVELPESPATWYAHIDAMEMRGWIALGTYLTGTTDYGMDIVVLDSICDRLHLQRRTVRDCIIQLSDPQKMAWTQLATAVVESRTSFKNEIQRLEYVQEKLHSLYTVAQRIRPTPCSTNEVWRLEVVKRLRGYLIEVVAKRIEHRKTGTPLVGLSTCTQVSVDIQEALRLNYLYEAMQQERQVPLIRYGLFPDSPKTPLAFDMSHDDDHTVPVVRESFVAAECQHERSFSIAKVRSENRYLHGDNEQLRKHNASLVDANEKLVSKLAALSRSPTLCARPDWNANAPTAESTSPLRRARSLLLQVPSFGLRPRSLSDGAVQNYTAITKQKLHEVSEAVASQALRPHATTSPTLERPAGQEEPLHSYSTPDSRISPEYESLLSTQYEDVFAAFNEKPLPPLPLLHLNIGEQWTPLDTPCPAFRPPRAAGGSEITTPCTPTPASRQTKRSSLPTSRSQPVSPPPEDTVRKTKLVGEPSTRAPSGLDKNVTLASPHSNPDHGPKAPHQPVQSKSSLPVLLRPRDSHAVPHVRSISYDPVLRRITPYAEPPSPLGMAKSRVQSIVRRLEESITKGDVGLAGRIEHDGDGEAVGSKKIHSRGRLDTLPRNGDGGDDEGTDVSRNF